MAYQAVNEPIEVLVAFKGKEIEPMLFKWGGRHYRVKRVNLVHTERQGREKHYIFSVSDEANAFRLRFSTETLKWSLEEMASL
ncbi:MAG: hypothetical protein WC750_02860 [Patescibacteria group bacterium]|jgi:hypothetical protein